MTDYLIEFALIHVVLFALYKLLLGKETQVAFMRFYLLAATALALVIPLVQLPNLTPVEGFNITGQVSAIVLPEMQAATPAPAKAINPFLLAYLLVTGIMALRFLISLIRILTIYRKSEPWQVYARNVRHYRGLTTSFTFFKWIFIDKDKFDDPHDIVRHEEAHIIYGHSYDLLILNLLLIPFWWVPSLWLALRELKQLHEFQADAYALANSSAKKYLHTLISHTLKQQGFMLTNSFNDTPLTKRLKYMKQLKKKISPWKVTSVIAMLMLTVYAFSCQEFSKEDMLTANADDEIFQIVETSATFPGGMEAFREYMTSELKYPEKAMANKVSGKVFVEFVVNKDGTLSDFKVLRGIGSGCDEEALRVIKNSPPWTPGKQKGHLVRQRLVMPIEFRHPDDEVIEVPDEDMEEAMTPPEFEDGITEFYNYALKSIQYPQEALDNQVSGKVFVQFIVKEDGSIGEAKVIKGLGYGLDEEALRIIKDSPKWKPAMKNGNPVEIKLVIPINFVAADDPAAIEMQKIIEAKAQQN